MGYVIMVRQPTYPGSLYSLAQHWTEITEVDGKKIYTNDRSSVARPTTVVHKPLVFDDLAEAEEIVSLWCRLYNGGARFAVKIVEHVTG